MRICFVGQGSVRAFLAREKEKFDVIAFGFNGMDTVCYEAELKGESAFFEDAARLSERAAATVVSGCVTDTHGYKRRSAVVASGGRLIGVSDALYAVDGRTGCGAALRCYPTAVGNMGVVVAEDVYFADAFRALSLCGCDFIVCPFGRVTDALQSVLLRAYAFACGVPIFFCGKGYCLLADPRGEVAFASPDSPAVYEYRAEREYHLLETRRRGFFRSV